MPTRTDPDLYHRLSAPRPKAEVASSIDAFDAELYALRVKYGITDLSFVVAVPIEGDKPGRHQVSVGHYGSNEMALPMLASAFRHHRDQRDAALLGIATGSKRDPDEEDGHAGDESAVTKDDP